MSFLNKLTFHNAKKLVSSTTAPAEHPTEAADPAFDASVAEFNAYHDSVVAIERSMSEYAKHMYDLYNSSARIIESMSSAISNNDTTTLRNTFAHTRDTHALLTSDREQTISADLRANCLKPLTDELTQHTKLQQAIQQRHELARELDYYSQKLNALLADKSKSEAKGKEADMEKLQRNQQKKDEAAQLYSVVNAEVAVQLKATVQRKGELLLKVFNSFEHIERQVAELYLAAVAGNGAVASSGFVSIGGSAPAGVVVSEVASSSASRFAADKRGSGSGSGGVEGGVSYLGTEGVAEGQPNALGSTLNASSASSSYRSSTPPPPSYTPSAYPVAPVAGRAGKPPGSPQPHPPPPPPPPPAKHL